MSFAEFELACVVIVVFSLCAFVAQQKMWRNVSVFLLACFTGLIAQLPLGKELNLYTPNITLYVSFVSVAVIVTWGIGLMSIHATHLLAARLLRIRPGTVLFLFCCFPVIVILEFTGSNIIHMKLYNYAEYSSLMPQFNSMHAPPWLYAYYGVVQFMFYQVLSALGLASEARNEPAICGVLESCTPETIEK